MLELDNSLFQIGVKVFVTGSIFYNEFEYMFGSKKGEPVKFSYIRPINGGEEETTVHGLVYSDAFKLALRRAKDGRYKNYTFQISA